MNNSSHTTCKAGADTLRLVRDLFRRRWLYLFFSVMLTFLASYASHENFAGLIAVGQGLVYFLVESKGAPIYVRRIIPVARRTQGIVLWLPPVAFFPLIVTVCCYYADPFGVEWPVSPGYLGLLDAGAGATVLLGLLLVAWIVVLPWPDRASAATATTLASIALVGAAAGAGYALYWAPQYDSPAVRVLSSALSILAIGVSLAMSAQLADLNLGQPIQAHVPRASTPAQRAQGFDKLAIALDRAVQSMERMGPLAHMRATSRHIALSAVLWTIVWALILLWYLWDTQPNWGAEERAKSDRFIFMGVLLSTFPMVDTGRRFPARLLRTFPLRGPALCRWLIWKVLAVVMPFAGAFAVCSYLLDERLFGVPRIAGATTAVLFASSVGVLAGYVSRDKTFLAVLPTLVAMQLVMFSPTMHSGRYYSPYTWVSLTEIVACLVLNYAAYYYLLVQSTWSYRQPPRDDLYTTKEV